MKSVNELERTVEIVEIKRNPERIDWALLKVKGEYFLNNSTELKGYTVTYKGLSLQDM